MPSLKITVAWMLLIMTNYSDSQTCLLKFRGGPKYIRNTKWDYPTLTETVGLLLWKPRCFKHKLNVRFRRLSFTICTVFYLLRICITPRRIHQDACLAWGMISAKMRRLFLLTWSHSPRSLSVKYHEYYVGTWLLQKKRFNPVNKNPQDNAYKADT